MLLARIAAALASTRSLQAQGSIRFNKLVSEVGAGGYRESERERERERERRERKRAQLSQPRLLSSAVVLPPKKAAIAFLALPPSENN